VAVETHETMRSDINPRGTFPHYEYGRSMRVVFAGAGSVPERDERPTEIVR
jgi:hypothetical protein